MLIFLICTAIFGGFVLRWRRESLSGFFGRPGSEPGIFHYAAGHLFVLLVGAVALWGSLILLLFLGNWAWAAAGLILVVVLQKPLFVWFCGKPRATPRSARQESLEPSAAPPRVEELVRTKPGLKYGLDLLRAGISVESAIAILLDACNKPDTMFITDRWIQPRLEQLRSGLSDPLTLDQAQALRDAIMQRSPFKDVLDWLSGEPMPWLEYLSRKREREARAKQERTEQIRKNWDWDRAKRLMEQGVHVHIPPEVLFREKEKKNRDPKS
jgi:hypothetical protein